MNTEPKMPPLPDKWIAKTMRALQFDYTKKYAQSTALTRAVESARDKQWAERVAELESVLEQISRIQICRGMDSEEAIERGMAAIGYANKAIAALIKEKS